ncbi:hypothetical protein [Kocuria massiliensis]|uniref:hypothetical protein n=1 Tax=Kocuria massiliensis TaxID=1926282 RepID=UPI0022B9BA02|nr:hypothetical protein [Kocuria massiliensis]
MNDIGGGMRVTGWLQAGVIMLVLGILVGGYGIGIWALALGHGTDADSGAKIASPIMMLAAIPLLVLGLAMTISGLVGEKRARTEFIEKKQQEADRTVA